MRPELATPSGHPPHDPDTVEGGADTLDYQIHHGFDSVEHVWRDLESRAVITPYQRFDWAKFYCASGFAEDADIRIVEICSNGRPVALVPLMIAPFMGAARGRLIGADISNGDALIVAREYAGILTPEVLRGAAEAVRADGTRLDLVLFANWSDRWRGVASPLIGLPHTPAPNRLYRVDLPTTKGGSFIEEAFPHKRRTNIKRSVKRLSETFGPVELRTARTPEDVAAYHAVFLDQRAKRFRQMGVTNVFAREPFQRLFIDGAMAGLDQRRPLLRLHALFAGETLLATSVGTYAQDHYSQYINSTSDGPAAKYTLMGVMMSHLIDELRADGVTSLDMGLGDFDYKVDWTEPVTVYDTILAVSPRGRLLARALGTGLAFKRAVKGNPVAWRAARSIMAVRSRFVK